ncbi:hypothetical protein R3P38DRAFT_3234812 [Favolaschia claudopus]|uniref:Uncharacterized protein n=1 Tax=Favolaschia claudopus TaxID=2862362 RepID=A0AAV9ZGB5_9AGAR
MAAGVPGGHDIVGYDTGTAVHAITVEFQNRHGRGKKETRLFGPVAVLFNFAIISGSVHNHNSVQRQFKLQDQVIFDDHFLSSDYSAGLLLIAFLSNVYHPPAARGRRLGPPGYLGQSFAILASGILTAILPHSGIGSSSRMAATYG